MKMVTNKKLSGIHMIILSSLLLFSFAPSALADDSYGVDVGQKLGRGLANAVTGWIEIPKNIVNTSRDSNVGIGVTWGFLKGIGHTLGRTLVGAGELATFFIPTPEIIHPTYIFQNFYQDTTYGTGGTIAMPQVR